MRQGPLRQGMAPETAAGAEWQLTARSIGLPVVPMDGTFIEPHTVCPGSAPSRLLFVVETHCRDGPVMVSLVEALESVRGGMEDRLYRRQRISHAQTTCLRRSRRRNYHTPVGIVPPTELGNGDNGPQTLLSFASSSLRRSSLAIRSACSNCVAWSSFSSSKTRQISSREAKGYWASISRRK